MANTLITDSVITKESLAILHQKSTFLGTINRQYDDSYAQSGAKIGSNLKIRRPNEFTVRTGTAIDVQDVSEDSVTMTLATQKGVDFEFDSEDLTMTIDNFKERYLEPAMSVLAAHIENDALSMYKDVPNFFDGVSAATTFKNMTEGAKLLTDSLAPLSMRSALISTQSTVDVLVDTKGLFHESSQIAKQYREGFIGRIAGMDFHESTLTPAHTTGTAAEGDTGYNINGTTEAGSAITVDGGTKTFLKGDIITFAGAFSVHPETKVASSVLQNFAVTADSGASATSLAISPDLVVTGGRQNVSAFPTNDGIVAKIGGGDAATWQQDLVYHRDAFAFVSADLVKPKGVDFCAREVLDGISMRIVRQYDITNDSFPCRIDVLYGFKTIRPTQAARIGHNT